MILPPGVVSRALRAVAGGPDGWYAWDWKLSTGIWYEPALPGALLLPNVLSPTWETDASGSNARESSFTYPGSPSDWVAQHRGGVNGNIYVESWSASRNSAVASIGSFAANEGYFVSFYPPVGLGKMAGGVILETGWGAGPSSGSAPYLAVDNSGEIAVYVGLDRVGTIRPQSSDGAGIGEAVQSMIVLPFGGNKLLVRTSWAGSAVHEFTHITPTNSSVIGPAGSVWWRVPDGRPSVQLARLRFATPATLYSLPLTLPEAPATGRSFSTVLVDGGCVGAFIGVSGALYDDPVAKAVVSVVDASTLSAFFPDGVSTSVRLKVVLTGGTSWSPFVEGAAAKMPPVLE